MLSKRVSKSFTSFLVTVILSVSTGTSWGAAGTVGAALISVAAGMGAPLIFAIIWGFTGFGIAKIKKGSAAYEEYLELSGKTE